MKITVDESGQIKLPEEILKEAGIEKNSILHIDTDYFGDKIIIQKTSPGCFICNCGVDLVRINNKYICAYCIKILKNANTGESVYVGEIH